MQHCLTFGHVDVRLKELAMIATLTHTVSTPRKIDIQNPEELNRWCQRLECNREQLLYCVMKVGNSPGAVTDFLHMNKDRLEQFFQLLWDEIKIN